MALFIVEIFSWIIPSAQAATLSWWNTNYAYRKKITVSTGSASVTSGYSVSLTFDHASLVTAAKSLSSGNDVRIVYWSGSAWTELDRIIDPSSSWNTATTKIWFKLQAAIAASSSDDNYYMYYGYSGAGSPPANGQNIFLFYDDFNDNSLDTANRWTKVIGGGTADVLEQNQRLEIKSGNSYRAHARTKSSFTPPYVLEVSAKISDQNIEVAVNWDGNIVSGLYYVINNGYYAPWYKSWQSATKITKMTGGSQTDLASSAALDTNWHRYKVIVQSSGTTIDVYKDGSQILTTTDTTYTSGYIGFSNREVATTNALYDDVWVRKYVSPEPTTSLGSEEMRPGISTISSATSEPFQRKSFYANGRFWIFYSDGSNIVFISSTDGSTWSAPTAVRSCSYGGSFSIWYNGSHVSYACSTTTAIYYRCGTPNSDGTITWSASEQTVVSESGYEYLWPFIAVDSNGYPWIGYQRYPSGQTTNTRPYVTKSSKKDGNWQTAFAQDLAGFSLSHFYVVVVPLTGGKVGCIYTSDNNLIRIKFWTGSSWSNAATTEAGLGAIDVFLSAVAQGDVVHVVFLKSYDYPIIVYINCSYHPTSPSWGDDENVQGAPGNYVTSTSAPVLSINTANNDLYCFWASHPTTDHIYYKKRVGGTWDSSPTDWINEATDHLTANELLTCFYSSYGYKIGLVYMTRTSSPYNVKFNYLSMPIVPEYPFGPIFLLLICSLIYLIARRHRVDRLVHSSKK